MSENDNENSIFKTTIFGIIFPLTVIAIGFVIVLFVMDFGYSNMEKESIKGQQEIGSIVKFYNLERGNEFKKERLEKHNEDWELKHITSSFLSPTEYYYERIS